MQSHLVDSSIAYLLRTHKDAGRTLIGPWQDIMTFQEFERALQDALPQLYHPTYAIPDGLRERLGCASAGGAEAVQEVILRAVEELKPPPNVPACARNWRIYNILSWRYVQKLTQEETAELLAITPRHLRREQRLAVKVLARHFWGRSYARPPEGIAEPNEQAAEPDEAPDSAVAWRSQVKQELASLQRHAPDSVTKVSEAMRSVARLVQPLLTARGISLELEPVEEEVNAAIHPSQLSQILVASITRLARNMSGGSIGLRAAQEGGWVRITVAGSSIASQVADDYLTDEVLAMQGGSIALQATDGEISFCLDLPAVGRIRVLVIDDNSDLVHFYQRYALRTRYDVVSLSEGRRVFETVQALAPDIIVLDVMLPDVDGWELLAQLHEDPITRSIPVIVCSVVREEELSLALGAALHLAKPVRRAAFLQALDDVLKLPARGDATAHGSS